MKPDLTLVETLSFEESQKMALMNLWNAEYPASLAYAELAEFEQYLNHLINPKHFLLHDEQNQIKAWAFSFLREGAIWFAIILAHEIQKQGFGKQLLDTLKSENEDLNGWVVDHNATLKVNGEIYLSPLAFYEKSGFSIIDGQRIELEKISAVKIQWKRDFDSF